MKNDFIWHSIQIILHKIIIFDKNNNKVDAIIDL